jgi:beta-lactamase class A
VKIKSALLGAITAAAIYLGFLLIISVGPMSKPVPPLGMDSPGEQPLSEELSPSITFTELSAFLDETPGTYGLYIQNLSSEEKFEYNVTNSYWAASLYKIFVGGAVYDLISQDKLSKNYVYNYEPGDYQDGTGKIQLENTGTAYTVDELLDLLLKNSDNIAQNILTRNIGRNTVIDYYENVTPYTDGRMFIDQTSTPERIARSLVNIYRTDSWSRSLKREFFMRMVDTEFEDFIPAGLPEDMIFAHKIGISPDALHHDCGVAFSGDFENPTVVCLMSNSTTEDFVSASKKVGEFVSSFY